MGFCFSIAKLKCCFHMLPLSQRMQGKKKKRFMFVNVNIQEDTILLAAVYVSRLVRFFFF